MVVIASDDGEIMGVEVLGGTIGAGAMSGVGTTNAGATDVNGMAEGVTKDGVASDTRDVVGIDAANLVTESADTGAGCVATGTVDTSTGARIRVEGVAVATVRVGTVTGDVVTGSAVRAGSEMVVVLVSSGSTATSYLRNGFVREVSNRSYRSKSDDPIKSIRTSACCRRARAGCQGKEPVGVLSVRALVRLGLSGQERWRAKGRGGRVHGVTRRARRFRKGLLHRDDLLSKSGQVDALISSRAPHAASGAILSKSATSESTHDDYLPFRFCLYL